MFIGIGTLTNVVTVLVGGGLGLLIGGRLDERIRSTVTTALGLVTLLIAADAAVAVGDPALTDAVGTSAPMLIVLGSLLIGGIVGSWWRLEDRLTAVGGWLQRRLVRRDAGESPDTDGVDRRARFVEGFVISSLVFCVGPLTILGSFQEGIGNGPDQLWLKSLLDGFAALAFAASLGVGVLASALAVAVVQGGLTLVGVAAGSVLPEAHLAAITATGGLILIGVALRLLDLKSFPVADLLPALLVAPLLTAVVLSF
ncbi:hypothetical protein HMPREF0063_10532 [Aeromicrobium marinum DSM 15272]|uniref:DUF554 domain-containing protein n=1 Tax=Aeromicrobium marinum DSM 15272 TaxID=585531 RepID=E2S992_9ACTN|nr:DUF554 domain-containing protein [Aeromicrobium marinum]EFQ83816.1 hypothetical protein HMPREF0063_10532 [Aeromicrobium marinum DSM 15272]